jgi:hypothetical protein
VKQIILNCTGYGPYKKVSCLEVELPCFFKILSKKSIELHFPHSAKTSSFPPPSQSFTITTHFLDAKRNGFL